MNCGNRRAPHSPLVFFFNDTATTEIYTLSLPAALPIYVAPSAEASPAPPRAQHVVGAGLASADRSEEHTSELQSPDHLGCRLLLANTRAAAQSCASCGGRSSPSPPIRLSGTR